MLCPDDILDSHPTLLGITKVSAQSLKALATEENVSDVISIYMDYFSNPVTADPVDISPLLDIKFGDNVAGTDPGVEVEIRLDAMTLCYNLGYAYKDLLPVVSVNRLSSCTGVTGWSPETSSLFVDNAKNRANPDMRLFRLHYHQLAGVHSILRNSFTKQPVPGGTPGMLIADEVGLGKTFLAATTMITLSDIRARQKLGHPLPPLIGKSHVCYTRLY